MQILLIRAISVFVMLASLLSFFGCTSEKSPIPKDDAEAFSKYWFQGKAEITSYDLSQSRYGTTHPGSAVLVFVTEDFSKSKHVKLEKPEMHKTEAIRVMKLNFTKQFNTGIYQYNLMNSIFTPLDVQKYPRSFKLTSGAQEWCGQSFIQYNWKGNRYELQHMSYFENEADAKFSLANGWLEDEVWTKIRMAPETLPIGDVKLIPAAFYTRLTHTEIKVYDAHTSLKQNGPTYTYEINYPDLKRNLSIEFETDFPHRILSWREQYGENEVTTGRLKQSLMSDYWLHQQPQDTMLRTQLQLSK